MTEKLITLSAAGTAAAEAYRALRTNLIFNDLDDRLRALLEPEANKAHPALASPMAMG